MRNITISAIALLLFILVLCVTSNKESKIEKTEYAHPLFEKGQEVKFKASKFGKKAVIIGVDTMDKQNIVYLVSYFTLWDTRRVKRVSEFELEAQ